MRRIRGSILFCPFGPLFFVVLLTGVPWSGGLYLGAFHIPTLFLLPLLPQLLLMKIQFNESETNITITLSLSVSNFTGYVCGYMSTVFQR